MNKSVWKKAAALAAAFWLMMGMAIPAGAATVDDDEWEVERAGEPVVTLVNGPVFDARPGQETYTAEEYRFGKRLLDRRDPVLRDWLDWQIAVKENVPALAAEVAGLRRVRGLWTEEKGGA